MSKRLVIILVLTFLGAVGLSGCDPVMTCEPDMLVRPVPISPEFNSLVDPSSVVLEWIYPDLCRPETFIINLYRDADRSDRVLSDRIDGMETTWSPAFSLDSADQYWWTVHPEVGDTSYSGADVFSFRTGPVCEPSDLVAPVLISPFGGEHFDREVDVLEWEWPLSTCIPSHYAIEVSTTSDFSDTSLFRSALGTHMSFSDGPEATQLWWRVIPGVESVSGMPSETETFFTDPSCSSGSVLVPPTLLTPVEGEIVTTSEPLFDWEYSGSCAPVGFDFRIGFGTEFWPPVHEISFMDGAFTSYTVPAPLEDCSTYSWYVAVEGGGGSHLGPYSEMGEFSTDFSGSCGCALDSIPVPFLVHPTLYEIVSDLRPTLDWDNPGDCLPDSYLIELSDDPFYTDSSLDGEVFMPGPTYYNPLVDLEPATQYYWKIAAKTGEEISEFSRNNTFYTGPECPITFPPAAPERIYPLDGDVLDTERVTLHFTPGADCVPERFFINLQTDPSFGGENIAGDEPWYSTYRTIPSLEDCTTYYWKLKASNASGESPESDVYWFHIDLTGSCPAFPAPGAGGTAKSANFCREGTFADHFEALWTFNVEDRVKAVAKNPQSTYYKFLILDQVTGQAQVPEIYCWAYGNHFESDLPGAFDQLPVEQPPQPPPPEELVCDVSLGPNKCKESGGQYVEINNYCDCH